jgi:hypothetical protein
MKQLLEDQKQNVRKDPYELPSGSAHLDESAIDPFLVHTDVDSGPTPQSPHHAAAATTCSAPSHSREPSVEECRHMVHASIPSVHVMVVAVARERLIEAQDPAGQQPLAMPLIFLQIACAGPGLHAGKRWRPVVEQQRQPLARCHLRPA